MLLPLMMSGAGLMDIVRALLGSAAGGASNDGLSAAIAKSFSNARREYPYGPDRKTITSASELLVDRLGVVPTSGAGQGLSRLFGGLYHLSPDTFGSILGIPNGGRFFDTLANGAAGINRAAGYGETDVLSPYSVMESHRRTMNLSKTVYGLGVKDGGGYDVGYTHGLNMEELGKVSQRILSSSIPYVDENGNGIDPESDKFKERMKKFGSKVNEAASSLAKVTGSVDEAISIMDKMAGGNFLAGSEEQASAVARRAKKIAAAVRVTSAMAGVSPQEVYADMRGLQGSIASAMGVNPYVANATGFSDGLFGMAYNGTMAANYFAATHPDATQSERELVRFVSGERSRAYGGSDAAALSAMVADNASSFDQGELQAIKNALRKGRPEDIIGMIRGKLGKSVYDRYMNDPSVRVSARKRASEENKDLLDELDAAGVEGNLPQAEQKGTRKILRDTIHGISEKLEDATGDSGTEDHVSGAVKSFLRKKAVEYGMSDEQAGKMDSEGLRNYLRVNGMDSVDLDREENSERVRATKEYIDRRTMSSAEEADAKQLLADEIDRSGYINQKRKNELKDMLSNGAGINDVFKRFSSAIDDQDEVSKIKRTVFGGKITSSEAEADKKRLDRIDKSQNDEYTDEERLIAADERMRRYSIENRGRLLNIVASGANPGAAAANSFVEAAAKEGFSADQIGSAYDAAAKSVVDRVFGDSFGGMSDEELKKTKSDVASHVSALVKSGSSVEEALKKATVGLSDEQKNALAASIKNNEAYVSDKAFLSDAAGDLNQKRSASENEAFGRFKRFASGDYGGLSGEDAIKQFAEDAWVTGAFGGDKSAYDKMLEDARGKFAETGNVSDTISSMLKVISPKGVKKGRGFYAGSSTDNPQMALIAYSAAIAREKGFTMYGPDGNPVSAESLLSNLDDAQADRTMNRVHNAIANGDADFTKKAVESTKAKAAELGDILYKSGISADTLRDLAGDDKEKSAAARKLIEEKALNGRESSSRDIAIIRAMAGTRIGGKDGAQVLLGGKSAIENAGKEKGGEEAFTEVTKKVGREESGAFSVLDALGGVLEKIAPYLGGGGSAPPIPVSIKSCDADLKVTAS